LNAGTAIGAKADGKYQQVDRCQYGEKAHHLKAGASCDPPG